METAIYDGICRCCASEGSFKDVNDTYHWMGEEEVYADMLKECFNVSLSLSAEQNGGICEVCITQLRNASNFKKQVLHTEEQFQKHLHMKIFKPVKIEVDTLENKHENDDNSSIEDGFSGTEIDMPIKSEDTPEEAKPKKRAAKTAKSKTKKSKSEKAETSNQRAIRRTKIITIGTSKPTVQHLVAKSIQCVPDSKKPLIEKKLSNTLAILKYSNASPIRCKTGDGYGCLLCSTMIEEPSKLKEHYLKEHSAAISSELQRRHFECIIKLDITDLTCNLCGIQPSTLKHFADHLTEKHKKTMFKDVLTHIVPFKFDTADLRCVECSAKFYAFKLLLQHMSSHYRNYICTKCGASFLIDRLLQVHLKRHGVGEYKCLECDKTFISQEKMKNHLRAVHHGMGKRNKCKYCHERFTDYWQCVAHMVKEHGMEQVVLKCNACERTFDTQTSLARHTRKDHLLERAHQCPQCEKTFFCKNSLNWHMTKHTGVKKYQCNVCQKAYGRPNTLRQHLRIHENDRRFACGQCAQAFVQKSSLKYHMLSKHGEVI